MLKTITCEMNDERLKCDSQFSDRYVYSNYYVPVTLTFKGDKTPILPDYKKLQLIDAFQHRVVDAARIVQALSKIGLGDLLTQNRLPVPSVVSDPTTECRAAAPCMTAVKEKLATNTADVRELLGIVEGKLTDSDRGVLRLLTRKLQEVQSGADGASVVTQAALQSATAYAISGIDVAGGATTKDEVEFFLNLLQSDVGYLFLDRTRVRPNGFSVGEHVFALSLAPGEEIVLEQKAYSKRQTTLEEQSEREQQLDLEMASTLSTELQEGLERQKSLTDSWGLTLSHTGQYTSPQLSWGSLNASHTVGYTKNVTEANTETKRRSVKDTQTATSRVAAKYRTLHKTTFKISAEQGFESTSKRVIRNPNRFTPIQLHYFKILQQLEMSQERYGVRLCWSPSIRDPAYGFFDRIAKGKTEILRNARAALPPKPAEPTPTPPKGEPISVPTQWGNSTEIEADKWSGLGYVAMSHDYEMSIPIPSGYEWDDDLDTVKASVHVRVTGPLDLSKVGHDVPSYPWTRDGNLIVSVHIGAPDGLGGRHIFIQVGARFRKTPSVAEQPAGDPKYNDDLAAYRTALKEWNDNTTEAMAQAQKAAETWEQGMLKGVDPLAEMINQIVHNAALFPPIMRDECWEIELWQKLFDWDRATYVPFPGWWSELPMRDPTHDPVDFVNASWAKLYLPIRVGMERMALRWIFGRVVATNLAPEIETRFETLETDLRNYRETHFGGPSEMTELTEPCQPLQDHYLCLAKWSETMPTDGTHLEIVQSRTTAADTVSQNEANDAAQLRATLIDAQEQNAELKKKALSKITDAPSVEIKIETGREPSAGQP